MTIARGYQSSATLSNGGVFTVGGSWSGGLGNKDGEVWTSSTGWQRLSGVPEDPILGPDPGGIYRADNHAWLFGQPTAACFMPTQRRHELDRHQRQRQHRVGRQPW